MPVGGAYPGTPPGLACGDRGPCTRSVVRKASSIRLACSTYAILTGCPGIGPGMEPGAFGPGPPAPVEKKGMFPLRHAGCLERAHGHTLSHPCRQRGLSATPPSCHMVYSGKRQVMNTRVALTRLTGYRSQAGKQTANRTIAMLANAGQCNVVLHIA